jgi:hypothetical protein
MACVAAAAARASFESKSPWKAPWVSPEWVARDWWHVPRHFSARWKSTRCWRSRHGDPERRGALTDRDGHRHAATALVDEEGQLDGQSLSQRQRRDDEVQDVGAEDRAADVLVDGPSRRIPRRPAVERSMQQPGSTQLRGVGPAHYLAPSRSVVSYALGARRERPRRMALTPI